MLFLHINLTPRSFVWEEYNMYVVREKEREGGCCGRLEGDWERRLLPIQRTLSMLWSVAWCWWSLVADRVQLTLTLWLSASSTLSSAASFVLHQRIKSPSLISKSLVNVIDSKLTWRTSYNKEQELIRRWDSERELLYDDNIHVEASAYANWTDLLISTKYLW